MDAYRHTQHARRETGSSTNGYALLHTARGHVARLPHHTVPWCAGASSHEVLSLRVQGDHEGDLRTELNLLDPRSLRAPTARGHRPASSLPPPPCPHPHLMAATLEASSKRSLPQLARDLRDRPRRARRRARHLRRSTPMASSLSRASSCLCFVAPISSSSSPGSAVAGQYRAEPVQHNNIASEWASAAAPQLNTSCSTSQWTATDESLQPGAHGARSHRGGRP